MMKASYQWMARPIRYQALPKELCDYGHRGDGGGFGSQNSGTQAGEHGALLDCAHRFVF